MIGFVFARSVREVTPATAAALAAGLRDRVAVVAVMRHPSRAAWEAVRDTLAPDCLQTDAADYAALGDAVEGVERLPVFRSRRAGTEGLAAAGGRLVLFEGADSGTGRTADWNEAAAFAADVRVVLAGGLSPGNVAEAVRRVRPYGVDVSSGVEAAPGRKDPTRIHAFVAAARGAIMEREALR
jgi:phosphoribosylanthranilate isomerase